MSHDCWDVRTDCHSKWQRQEEVSEMFMEVMFECRFAYAHLSFYSLLQCFMMMMLVIYDIFDQTKSMVSFLPCFFSVLFYLFFWITLQNDKRQITLTSCKS